MKRSYVVAGCGLLVGLLLGMAGVVFGAAWLGLSPEAAQMVQPVTAAVQTRQAAEAIAATQTAMPTATRTPRPAPPTATPSPTRSAPRGTPKPGLPTPTPRPGG